MIAVMSTWLAQNRRQHPMLTVVVAVLLGAIVSTSLSELWGQGVPYAVIAGMVLVFGPIQMFAVRRRLQAEADEGRRARSFQAGPGNPVNRP
jgi:hypothetical protein